MAGKCILWGKIIIDWDSSGIVLSICFYKAFSEGIEIPYQLPYGGILIAIAAVFVLLFATTQYSMNKINRKILLKQYRMRIYNILFSQSSLLYYYHIL